MRSQISYKMSAPRGEDCEIPNQLESQMSWREQNIPYVEISRQMHFKTVRLKHELKQIISASRIFSNLK